MFNQPLSTPFADDTHMHRHSFHPRSQSVASENNCLYKIGHILKLEINTEARTIASLVLVFGCLCIHVEAFVLEALLTTITHQLFTDITGGGGGGNTLTHTVTTTTAERD